MINELYNRIAILKIFNTEVKFNPDGSLNLSNIQQTGKSFSSLQEDGSPGFRIRFHVDKVIEVTPNPTSIWIYNLGPDSRALFEKVNNQIELQVGYGDQPKTIFKGTVSRGRTTKVGPDYITHIEAGDGLFAVQNSQINQAFSQSIQTNTVITTLAEALKATGQIGVGQIVGVPNDGYNQGIVLTGNAVDQLKTVCDSKNLNFFIENQLVYILPIGQAKKNPPIIISPDSGLVGIPERRDVGMSFKVLLNPELTMFQSIVMKSKFINGIFNTVKVVHSGDTFGTEWYSQVEATYPANQNAVVA